MELDRENKLTDAELEQVTGGDDLADDSRYLNVLLRGREGQCERYGTWRSGSHLGEIARAWGPVGVDFGLDDEEDCFYYRIDGKEVSRIQAWLHAEQVVGKHLKRTDWDW